MLDIKIDVIKDKFKAQDILGLNVNPEHGQKPTSCLYQMELDQKLSLSSKYNVS